jgi:hypothetical protein
MKTVMLALALLLSSLSLALQLKTTRTASPFEKYLVTARISDLDYRTLVADNEIIQNSWIMNDGLGLPHVWGLSDDHQEIICRVDVSEKSLPKSHEEQKKLLEGAAFSATSGVYSAFDLDKLGDKAATHAVKVEFMNIDSLAKEGKLVVYAEFSDGQLTFH